jgi:Acetyltransferase (GNAT) domain
VSGKNNGVSDTGLRSVGSDAQLSVDCRTERYSAREILSEPEWRIHFSRLPLATFTQSWAYGDAKRAEGRSVTRLLIERGDTPIALSQVVRVRKLGVPFGARVHGGPLFFSRQSEDDEVRAACKLLHRLYCFPRGGVLLIAPGIRTANGGAPPIPGYRVAKTGWRSALVDLRKDAEELRMQPHPKWRNHLTRALRSPLQVEMSAGDQELNWLISRHEEHMRQKRFAGPHKSSFLRTFAAVAPSQCMVARAMLNDEPVSGMLVVRFDPFAEYLIGWYGESGRKHDAGNLLVWKSMLEMNRRGCEWFDLGGLGGDGGFQRFKAGVRGEVYELVGEWLVV